MGDTKRGIILDVEGGVGIRPLSASPRARVWWGCPCPAVHVPAMGLCWGGNRLAPDG